MDSQEQHPQKPTQSPQITPPATPAEPVPAPAPASNEAEAFPSSPFVTARLGAKRLWDNAKRTVASALAIQIGLIVAAVASAILAIIAASIALLKLALEHQNSLPPFAHEVIAGAMQAIGNWTSMTNYPLLITVVIAGVVVSGLLMSFAQTLQFAIIGDAVVQNRRSSLGDILTIAKKRFWPLTGLSALVGLIIMTVIVLPLPLLLMLSPRNPGEAPTDDALMALGTGVLLFIAYYLLVFGAGMYFAVRTMFAGQAIVTDNLGAIKAIKHSWRITKGHVWEVIGILSVVFLGTIIVQAPFELLSILFEKNGLLHISIAVDIIGVVVAMVIDIFLIAGLGERYAQLRRLNQQPAQHRPRLNVNFGALALATVATMLSGMLIEQVNPATLPPSLDTSIPQEYTVPDDGTQPLGPQDIKAY